MQLPVWLAQRHVAPVALVRGGSADDLLALMRGDGTPQLLIVCDRELADRLNISAVLSAQPRPTLRITRGLHTDLEVVLGQTAPMPALITASALRGYLDEERDRLGARIKMLAGYELPGSTLDQLTQGRAARAFKVAATRCLAPIVIHDEDARLRRAVLTAITVFEYPGSRHVPPAELDATAEPPIQVVLHHAHFLEQSADDVLSDLHAFLTVTEARAVFSVWDAQFVRLAHDPAHQPMAQVAREKLAVLQVALEKVSAGPSVAPESGSDSR